VGDLVEVGDDDQATGPRVDDVVDSLSKGAARRYDIEGS